MEQLNGIKTNKGKLNLRIYSRGGSKSPEHWQWFYKEHWVNEYENKKRWSIEVEVYEMMKIMYRNIRMDQLIYSKNPFLSLIDKS